MNTIFRSQRCSKCNKFKDYHEDSPEKEKFVCKDCLRRDRIDLMFNSHGDRIAEYLMEFFNSPEKKKMIEEIAGSSEPDSIKINLHVLLIELFSYFPEDKISKLLEEKKLISEYAEILLKIDRFN